MAALGTTTLSSESAPTLVVQPVNVESFSAWAALSVNPLEIVENVGVPLEANAAFCTLIVNPPLSPLPASITAKLIVQAVGT